jgi:hypothetical protein
MASILTHTLFMYALGWFGKYDLTGPVMLPHAVMVDLTTSPGTEPKPRLEPEIKPGGHNQPPEQLEPASSNNKILESGADPGKLKPEPAPLHTPQPESQTSPEPAPAPETVPQAQDSLDTSSNIANTPAQSSPKPAVEIAPPLRSASEFMSAEQETLSYRITLLGFPVGSGELKATQEKGDVKITLRVRSSLVIASVYPVDDLIETRLLGGNYIITKIKQKEGKFVGDRGFTLSLRETSVFWIDLLKQTSTREALPGSDVLDILSGLYYLRNRPLQVGKTETLHIFDSNISTTVPVEVLRRERIFLPGFRRVDTLLLHPLLKTEGIFKRAGEILIWVTDDEQHVPVRVETSIKLGTVTAELIDSEVTRKGTSNQNE